jgi:fructose-1,6-bisphosphatase
VAVVVRESVMRKKKSDKDERIVLQTDNVPDIEIEIERERQQIDKLIDDAINNVDVDKLIGEELRRIEDLSSIGETHDPSR